MAHTFAPLYTHIVFGTKNREPIIDDAPHVHAYIAGIIRALDGFAIRIGGMADHVHMLVRLRPTIALADAIGTIKGSSSKWMNENSATQFHWQKGYSAFSVSPSAVDAVSRYIEHQPEHHRHVTFAEEYLAFLAECGVEYDERYVFE